MHFCQSWSNFIKSCKIIIHFTSFFLNCWPGFPNGNLSYNIYNSRPFYYVNWHCWPTFNSISSLEFLKWHCWPDSYTNLTQQIYFYINLTLYNFIQQWIYKLFNLYFSFHFNFRFSFHCNFHFNLGFGSQDRKFGNPKLFGSVKILWSNPSSIYSWFLKPLSVLHSRFPTKKSWVAAYFFNFFQLFQGKKNNIKAILCNFSMPLLKCF